MNDRDTVDAFLATCGWTQDTDGFDRPSFVAPKQTANLPLSPTPSSPKPTEIKHPYAQLLTENIMLCAELAAELGLWETPRALLRARQFAMDELKRIEVR